jgi:CRISPR-associated protein Cas5t
MLRLYVQAPFAACRSFTAGWYRPTSSFLTPSAAYGLLLNVAGIESRLREGETGHDGRVPTTLTRSDLPACRLALGLPDGRDPPRVQSVFQQLHNYPVGSDAGLPPELARGNKNNITPVRREFLMDLQVVVVVDGADDFEHRIVRGVRGELNADRYGLPFVGDNNFLIDRLVVLGQPGPVRWYELVESAPGGPRPHTTRLTIQIDRADMSGTRSALYAPSEALAVEPPAAAWTQIGSARS